jgi:SAM-dependent methyltransferase
MAEREIEVDEPLRESARWAYDRAHELCRDVHGCIHYHGLWQYLRLFGITTSIRNDTPFLLDALREAARGELRRILISGTADYGMLAHVLAAYRAEARRPEVVIVDTCETPLRLNHWYAERCASTVETRRSDILRFTPEEPFDLICTHNFMGRFVPGKRERLTAHWFSLLRPGGVLVTAQRLRRKEPRMSAERVEAKKREIRLAAERYGAPSDPEPAQLAEMFGAFLASRRPRRLRTADELRALFEHAGFRILRTEFESNEELRRARVPRDLLKDDRRIRIVVGRP